MKSYLKCEICVKRVLFVCSQVTKSSNQLDTHQSYRNQCCFLTCTDELCAAISRPFIKLTGSMSTVFFRSQGVQEKVETMNLWYIIFSSLLCLHLTPLRVSVICLFCSGLGGQLPIGGKRCSSLTFLCVVITEETATTLAGLYSLALFFFFLHYHKLFLFGENIFISQLPFLLVCSLFFSCL